jgi:hypothetical protein
MKNKFFKIPVSNPDSTEKELNNFCSTRSINHVERHFVPDGENSFWAIAVTYTDQDLKGLPKDKRSTRIDYKEILSSDDFNIYAQLRDLRADISKEEGVPLYAIFSNAVLVVIFLTAISEICSLLKIA